MMPDLSSMTSLTGGGSLQGGNAGPSTASSTFNNKTLNDNGFRGNTMNMGSNGLPWWVLVLAVLVALWIFKGK